MSASDISNKVWGYAKVLLDDGVSYNDYVEQLTYLIFLKMADERADEKGAVPTQWSWPKLVKLDGDDLEIQYRHTLENLGKLGGMLGTIFRKAQNKIQECGRCAGIIGRMSFAPTKHPASLQVDALYKILNVQSLETTLGITRAIL